MLWRSDTRQKNPAYRHSDEVPNHPFAAVLEGAVRRAVQNRNRRQTGWLAGADGRAPQHP